MKENTLKERELILARQASSCIKQEVLLNTYHISLWDAQPLLQCSTHAPPPSSLLHQGAAPTSTARSLSKHCLHSPTHQDSYFHCSWIDHIQGKKLSALFLARSGQKLLQNMPICLSNYILKVLHRNRDIASDLQTTHHFSILIFYTICS